MKKTLLAVLALLLGLTVMAEGADWTLVSESPEGKKWFVDKQSIQCLPNTIKARIKRVAKSPEVIHNKGYKEVIVLNEFDRKEKRLREVQVEILFMDGKSNAIDSKGDWMNIMRDSMYEAIYNHLKGVCK